MFEESPKSIDRLDLGLQMQFKRAKINTHERYILPAMALAINAASLTDLANGPGQSW